jgi:alanine racemase
VAYLAANNIRASLTSLKIAKALSTVAKTQPDPLKVHIKVDTGMGRLGFVHIPDLADATDPICSLQDLPGLEIEGLYTHMANADARDKTHANGQITAFSHLIRQLTDRGMTFSLCHAANSAGVIDLPGSHFDLVRPGIALYGLWPSREMLNTGVDLKPVLSITSKIIHLKKVPAGFAVSYGSTQVTERPTTIATVPIGYADGYSRLLSSSGQMMVRGYKAPVIGRVCMDFTMIDVGHIPDVRPDDQVIILGKKGNQAVTADDLADLTGTINYEITAALTRRIPIDPIHSGDTSHANG